MSWRNGNPFHSDRHGKALASGAVSVLGFAVLGLEVCFEFRPWCFGFFGYRSGCGWKGRSEIGRPKRCGVFRPTTTIAVQRPAQRSCPIQRLTELIELAAA
jgi:hypothetical protein